MTHAGLVRFLALFAIELKGRRIRMAGIAPEPAGRWMRQMGRNLTDGENGFLNGTRYLIRDGDPPLTPEFRKVLETSGVRSVKLPAPVLRSGCGMTWTRFWHSTGYGAHCLRGLSAAPPC